VIRVTADSNIYISALLRGGKPLELLELARAGQIELAVSDDILDEVARVLTDKFTWSAEDVSNAREQIGEFTTHVVPTERLDAVPSDPDDNRVLECAVAAGSEMIVTGDGDLLRLGRFRGIDIVGVADLLSRFTGRGR
jgi:putative PIN family toxin of toxin-antitoxin system